MLRSWIRQILTFDESIIIEIFRHVKRFFLKIAIVKYFDRRFHPFVQAGAVTNIELGGAEPPAAELAWLVGRAFRETQNKQLVFTPEFTSCLSCGATMRGLCRQCGQCGSRRVDGLAHITQYYSFVSGWNRGKRAELNDRNRLSFLGKGSGLNPAHPFAEP